MVSTSRLYGFFNSGNSPPIVTWIFSIAEKLNAELPDPLNRSGKKPGYGLGRKSIAPCRGMAGLSFWAYHHGTHESSVRYQILVDIEFLLRNGEHQSSRAYVDGAAVCCFLQELSMAYEVCSAMAFEPQFPTSFHQNPITQFVF